jgi:hypothetical protein
MSKSAEDFIPPEFAFLQEECGFRVARVNTGFVTDASAGSAELVGGNLRILFSEDPLPSAPMTILAASVHDEQRVGNWYIWIDLHAVMWLASKADPGTYPSDAEQADFLRTNMPMVQSMFSAANLDETKAARDKLTMEWLKKAEKAADRARRGRRLT